ncbi:MAG: hypothetical protein J0L75_09080, partial [Spirochaetes bacterium]|nr:hypothetical protein [Spirochaetota bacterium]
MKKPLRIRGLSGFAREISRMLLRAEDAILDEVLRLRVRRGIDLVERILAQSRIEVDDLAPSQRKAYTFLKRAAAPAQVVPFLAPEPARPVAGRYHDLAALWDGVNARYFESQMQPATLRWSQRASLRRLGFWDFGRDHIVISRSLDHPAVPA